MENYRTVDHPHPYRHKPLARIVKIAYLKISKIPKKSEDKNSFLEIPVWEIIKQSDFGNL